jgi:DNA polymerase-1
MVTDKDFAQLVSENIFMYKPARMGNGIEICVKSLAKFKWETGTSDWLSGMMGDAADNIRDCLVWEKSLKKFLKNTDPWRIF